jgi:hypothetical protein
VQNVERDPRVVLTIEAPSHNESGLRRYLVITGRARVQRGGAPNSSNASRTLTSALASSSLYPSPTRDMSSASSPTAWVASGPGQTMCEAPAPRARRLGRDLLALPTESLASRAVAPIAFGATPRHLSRWPLKNESDAFAISETDPRNAKSDVRRRGDV